MRSVTRHPDGGCWEFTGGIQSAGYGIVGGRTVKALAHVLSYVEHIGPVPEGMVVGHTCHDAASHAGLCAGGRQCLHRRCVNPEHLVAMTYGENSRASAVMGAPVQDFCKNGHEMATTRRVYMAKDGRRVPYCGVCRPASIRAKVERRAAERAAKRAADPRWQDDLSPAGKARRAL